MKFWQKRLFFLYEISRLYIVSVAKHAGLVLPHRKPQIQVSRHVAYL